MEGDVVSNEKKKTKAYAQTETGHRSPNAAEKGPYLREHKEPQSLLNT